jgi:hypothetical protein
MHRDLHCFVNGRCQVWFYFRSLAKPTEVFRESSQSIQANYETQTTPAAYNSFPTHNSLFVK